MKQYTQEHMYYACLYLVSVNVYACMCLCGYVRMYNVVMHVYIHACWYACMRQCVCMYVCMMCLSMNVYAWSEYGKLMF